MTGSWTKSFFNAPVTKLILDRIIPISPQLYTFIFTYQEWKIKGTICMQVEYDRTSYIVLKNFWLVYNFLWSGGGIICVLHTLHLKKSLLA